MSISVADVRGMIGDMPKWNKERSGAPEFLGYADGSRAAFRVKYTKAIAGTLDVQVGSIPAQPSLIKYLSVPPAGTSGPPAVPAWTFAPDPSGIYGMPPLVSFASAPASGLVVAAFYLVSAFTDAEIQAFMARADVEPTDRLQLSRVVVDIIPALVADQERMQVMRIGDVSKDPSSFASRLLQLRTELLADLAADPRDALPSGYNAITPTVRYGPR